MKEENERISAFAFRTGREIENLINDTTHNLREENQYLQARILGFYYEIGDMDSDTAYYIQDLYKEYFNISKEINATIRNI